MRQKTVSCTNNITAKRMHRVFQAFDDIDDERAEKVMLKIINNELTTRQKEIIMLYYFKGLKVADIAEILNQTPQSVSITMRRGRERICKVIKYYI